VLFLCDSANINNLTLKSDNRPVSVYNSRLEWSQFASFGQINAVLIGWNSYFYTLMKPDFPLTHAPKPALPRYVGWPARILLSLVAGTIVYTIIWLSSQFRNPPGWSWLALLLLFITYLTYEVVSRVQQKLSSRNLVRHESLNMVFGMLLAILAGILTYSTLFYGFKWLDHWIDGSEPPFLQHMLMAVLIALILSIIFAFIQLGFNWRGEFYKSQIENERFKGEIAQANLAILKNQLDPHFMFNNFNTLYYLIDEDSAVAKQFLKNVSTIYRYILQNNDKALIPAREEYEMVRQYLAVIQQRYTALLRLEDEVSPDALDDKNVPPLVLQQLIENAIKHNRIDEESPLTIWFKTEDGFLTVTNNRKPKRPGKTAGTGLENIRKRYEYLTDRKVIIEESQESFTVSIPLIANA
jgi:hypothetical protein